MCCVVPSCVPSPAAIVVVVVAGGVVGVTVRGPRVVGADVVV